MRVLVCGSRSYRKSFDIYHQLATIPNITEVISGGASGADSFAEIACRKLGIPFRAFPADWDQLGRSAGYRRNEQMLEEGKPDLVLAFFSGDACPGTSHMSRISRGAGVPVRCFGHLSPSAVQPLLFAC